jgi:hypothetical protein
MVYQTVSLVFYQISKSVPLSKIQFHFFYSHKGQDSSVGIAKDYGPEAPGVIPGMEIFFSSSQGPGPIWGPPSLLSNW